MKVFHLFSLLLAMALASGLGAQDQLQLSADFGSQTQLIQTKDNSAFCDFEMKASQDQIDVLNSIAAEQGNYLSFSAEKQKESNSYSCKLSFLHNASSSEFYKTFMLFGIQQLIVNGEIKTIDYLLKQ